MLNADTPLVLLQHGGLDNLSGKTGLAMLRYRRGPIVAVIDPAHAGADLRAITGIDRAVPVVAEMAARGTSVVLTGFALPDDGYHAPDEHLRVEHFGLGVQAAEGILAALADLS